MVSAIALLAVPASAKNLMPPSNGPIGLTPYNTPNTNMPVLPGSPSSGIPSVRSNFTFIGGSGSGHAVASPPALAPLPVAPPVQNYSDPTRNGYGQDYDDGVTATPSNDQVLVPPSTAQPVMMGSGTITNPAAPPVVSARMMPGASNTYIPANAHVVAVSEAPPPIAYANTTALTDGQSFSGQISQPQQAGFYTLVARKQADFVDLWRNHIGQEPPAAQLQPGQAAVFATNGPQSYSGYNVTLRVLNEMPQKVQVLATEITPSSTVAQTRSDISPWQILIVDTNNAKVEVLHRKELAGSAFN